MEPFNIQNKAATITVWTLCMLSLGPVRADQKIVCPPEVTASQVSVAAEKGWTGWAAPGRKVKLVAAGVLLGPVRLNGELKGDEERRRDGSWVNRYVLTGWTGPEREMWMACNYAAEYFQAVQLPAATRECSVVYQRDKSSPRGKPAYVVADVTCK